MNVSIYFPEEIEQSLRSRAAASGQDVETFVRQLVTQQLLEDEPAAARQTSVAEFEKRLDAWINLHPKLDHAVDDSRESIYAGRGE